MSKKIILVIALICLLVPFMVLGSVASAEEVTESSYIFNYLKFSFINGITGTNAFQVDRTSNGMSVPYVIIMPTISTYYRNSPFGYSDINLSFVLDLYPTFSFSDTINASWRWSNSSVGSKFIEFSPPASSISRCCLLFTSTIDYGNSSYEFESTLYKYFAVNEGPLNSRNYTINKIPSFKVDDSTIRYQLVTSTYQPYFFDAIISGVNADMFMADNYLYMLVFDVVPSYNILRATTSYTTDIYMLGFYTVSVDLLGYDDGYIAGKVDGFIQAEQQFNDKLAQEKQQSYQNGYYAGLESAERGDFLSLFTSMFDSLVLTINGLLDFTFLGYNMLTLFKFIFTVGLVMLIFKIFNGGNNG